MEKRVENPSRSTFNKNKMGISMRILYSFILLILLSPMATGVVLNHTYNVSNNSIVNTSNISGIENLTLNCTLNTSKKEIFPLENISDENHSVTDSHLNITVQGFKVVIKTDGKVRAYVDNITLDVVEVENNTYILSPVVLNKTIHIYVLYPNKTLHRCILLNYSPEKRPYLKVYLNRSEKSYKVIVETDGKLNITYKNLSLEVKYERIGKDRYVIYPLILNNILVITSHYRNFTLRKEVSLSFNTSRCINRTLDIEGLIERLKSEGVKVLVSYDPTKRAIVIKILGDKKPLINRMFSKIRLVECRITQREICGNFSLYEVTIPLDRYNDTMKKTLLRRFNIPEEVLNTSVKTFQMDERKIRVEVENKLDNVWYRFSVKINTSRGYRVKEIVGDDGRVIVNNISIDRRTGRVHGDIRYYIENSTLYFYDDPIYGYNISLIPPAPHNSIAIEIANNDTTFNEGGQISAVVFPYNEGDDSDTIRSHDHAGREGDNYFGNDIDLNAGSKIAIKYTCNGNTSQFGNGFYPGQYDYLGKDYLDETYREYLLDHETPHKILESLIIVKMHTPWPDRELNITQKIIIRDNYRWFATVYYIKNPTNKTFRDLKFFQGMDWNFNNDYLNDECYYDDTYDVVYGHDVINQPNIRKIEYGGYKSILPSYEHEVNRYWNIWEYIKNDNLKNNSAFRRDAATALAWYKDTLEPNETWVVPIVWGLGFNLSDMLDQIEMGLNQLYDTGVKSIDHPYNGEVFNPHIHSNINVTSTVALYGIVDVENLNVSIEVRRIGGGYNYTNYTFVNLSIPNEEEETVVFPLNISGMPYGIYNISVRTNLPNDQNISNDEKSVVIYINSFSVEPHIQSKTSNIGESVYYNITLYNYGDLHYFDVNITNSTKNWPTYLYDGDVLIGKDEEGDGIWDFVSNDSNSNGLPEIYVNGTKNITVVKEIPQMASLGTTDTTTLEFVNINVSSIRDSTTFKTSTPLPPTVKKTFYLHRDDNRILNTTPPTEEGDYTQIDRHTFLTWAQYPRFADDFTLYGNISVDLYIQGSTFSEQPLIVILYATDGTSVIELGQSTLTQQSSQNHYVLNISLDSPVTIPKNYYLVLKIDNSGRKESIKVYHDIEHQSNVEVSTTTYVKIQECYFDRDVYYQGDVATIYVNVTDPIGAYDIAGAEIEIYHPDGTLLYSGPMELVDIDSNDPQLWKFYRYSFYLPDAGIYNITVSANESNGVVYSQNYSLLVRYYHNISTSISMTSRGYNISFIPYRPLKDVYIYWYKPENVGVLNISGDFDESGSSGNLYWFRYYQVEPYSKRYITIDTNISTVEGLNIGVN